MSIGPGLVSISSMRVKLTYFTKTGKYYTEGEYESDRPDFYEIVKQVKGFLADGMLPGLVQGAREFHALIEMKDAPPHMVFVD